MFRLLNFVSSTGIPPVSWFPAKSRCVRSVENPWGNVPSNLQSLAPICSSPGQTPLSPDGKLPEKELPDTSRNRIDGTYAVSNGIVPLQRLNEISTSFIRIESRSIPPAGRKLSTEGIVPTNWLWEIVNSCRVTRDPDHSGNGPVKRLSSETQRSRLGKKNRQSYTAAEEKRTEENKIQFRDIIERIWNTSTDHVSPYIEACELLQFSKAS